MTREQFISHVDATQKAFRRFLVALCCGDTALADDVAQESYIKAYLSCDSFSNLEKFNAWIFKIGYNTFINHKRGERLTAGYEDAKEIIAQSANQRKAMQSVDLPTCLKYRTKVRSLRLPIELFT